MMRAAARIVGTTLVLLGAALAVIPIGLILAGDWILVREEAHGKR